MEYISLLPHAADPVSRPRTLAVLGSTGSIGRNTLQVVQARPDLYRVKGLAGGRNIALLAEQAALLRPEFLAVMDGLTPDGISLAQALRKLLPTGYDPKILTGQTGFAQMASLDDVDVVLSAQVGASGLRSTVAAAMAGKTICLANKESLVMAGSLIRRICARTGAVILPVDSEHYALFQCLAGKNFSEVRRLILTASGGPFRGKTRTELERAGPKDALAHPNWNMGAKISIDSATLMNKGLEVIEACHLYGVDPEDVGVVIHQESIIHSLVEFKDASLLAQLAVPDMRLPIAACLAWPRLPERSDTGLSLLDLAETTLHFMQPDTATFPCLPLAMKAFSTDKTVELNAANEIAVERFLSEDISFLDIPALIHDVLAASPTSMDPDMDMPDPEAVEAALASLEERDQATRNRAKAWRVPLHQAL